MTSTLPVNPDLEHLRRAAKLLLRRCREGDPLAQGRLRTHAPGRPELLSTAQLVVAREHGFASWSRLASVVRTLSSGGVRYDAIGLGYTDHRRPDPRIAAVVLDALHGMRTVVNVGAGAGSYEPRDRPVVAIEPSTAMALQRPAALPPAVLGVAESLPLPDKSADAAMAVLTVHHWSDRARGLAELARVARRRVVLLTFDPEVEADLWLFRDYVPTFLERDRCEFPTRPELDAALGAATRWQPVLVPADCCDGFAPAYWNRPERLLDPSVRAATSGFARMDDETEQRAVDRLASDLDTGVWDRDNGHLRALAQLDVGLRLVVAEL